MNKTQTADLKWLRNAEHWSDGWRRFDEVTGEPEVIWLMKSTTGPKARFYGKGRGQVGPQHDSVYQAMLWAYGNGYLGIHYLPNGFEDADAIIRESAARAEVLAGGVALDAHLGKAAS